MKSFNLFGMSLLLSLLGSGIGSAFSARILKRSSGSFDCPPIGDHYYSHAECTKFIVCSNGIYYEMDCAEGTYWDQDNLICDYDHSVCSPPTTPAPPTDSPTQAPEEPTTPAPEEPTEAPEEPTEAPEEPTEAPEEPTEVPEEPTETPEEPTEAPEEPTEAPEEPTEAPEESTEAPEEPTEAPEEPTEAPEEPTQAPEEPTQEPTTENLFPCPATGYHTLAHPSVCNLYYRCYESALIGIFSCGTDKWFDSRTLSCLDPDESDCPY